MSSSFNFSRNLSNKKRLTNSYNNELKSTTNNVQYSSRSFRRFNPSHHITYNNNYIESNNSSNNRRVSSTNYTEINNNNVNMPNKRYNILNNNNYKTSNLSLTNKANQDNQTQINNRYKTYKLQRNSKNSNYNSFNTGKSNIINTTNTNNNNISNIETNRKHHQYFERIITNPNKLRTSENKYINNNRQKSTVNNNEKSHNFTQTRLSINYGSKPIKIFPRNKTNNYPQKIESNRTLFSSNEKSSTLGKQSKSLIKNITNNSKISDNEKINYQPKGDIKNNQQNDNKKNYLQKENVNDFNYQQKENINNYQKKSYRKYYQLRKELKSKQQNEDIDNNEQETNIDNSNNLILDNTKTNDEYSTKDVVKPDKIIVKKEEEVLFDVINKEIGIMNIGNTCFINACLQVLIHCPLFIYKLAKNLKLINEDTPITSNFLSICDLMLNTEKKYIDISDFKNLLGIKHKIFEGYLQNDSQEFCRILLEDISAELNEIKNKSLYRMLSNSNKKAKKVRDEDFHINFSEREKSIITDLFYAQIVDTFTCECGFEIYSFQKILDFPLLFPENIKDNIITLEELLQFYFKTELIDFEIKCDKCQQKSQHKKEIKMSRPPEILILSLQRINGNTQKKLKYNVKYPEILDISEFTDHECGFDKECIYYLFAIIEHYGSINSGHYYSLIKIGDKDWFEFNDSKVNNIETIFDTSEYVYALFYIKEKYINSNILKI